MITPNPDTVNSFLSEWNTLENYRLQEQSLSLLFNKFCPGNATLEFVLLKVTALNQFYSTYILDTEIDQRAYELYGLTPEEIKIEGGAAK